MKQLALLFFLLQTVLFSNDLELYEFRFHGNFCGANLPKVTTTDKDEELKILKGIQPIDVIDAACKAHDICYLHSDDRESTCDKKLVEDLKSIHYKLKDQSCKRLSKSIIVFFETKTDNPITVLDSSDSLAHKMADLPAVTFNNMMDTSSWSFTMGMNYGFTKPKDYIFDAENNSERRKEILQAFPPRYKKCELKK